MKLCSIFTVDKDIYRVLIKFLIVGKTKTTLFVYFFPPFIYFTSHLYCITRFEDEDAIWSIKCQVTKIIGEGRI